MSKYTEGSQAWAMEQLLEGRKIAEYACVGYLNLDANGDIVDEDGSFMSLQRLVSYKLYTPPVKLVGPAEAFQAARDGKEVWLEGHEVVRGTEMFYWGDAEAEVSITEERLGEVWEIREPQNSHTEHSPNEGE